MINVRPLIEQRLKQQLPQLSEIAGACSLAALMDGNLVDGGCYVIPKSTRAQPSQLINAVSQREAALFSIVTTVRNVRDASGIEAADSCFSLRSAISQALHGWTPHPDCEPFEKTSGQLLSFVSGFFVWEDVYTTTQLIRTL